MADEPKKLDRRDVLKGLSTLPALGLFGYAWQKQRAYQQAQLESTAAPTTPPADLQVVNVALLGAGAQGQTPLVRTAAGIRESRVSYFPQLHQYGVTVGQDADPSLSAAAALGLKQSPHDLGTCLGCHATSVSRNLTPLVPGIQCERCHPGAERHAAGKGMPLNPGKLKPAAQVQFCGACHRIKPSVDDSALENIRFQPLRLMKSRCFASGRLACTTCHAAHEDARRNNPDYYNSRCRTCHTASATHADVRAQGNCIGCHMPRVRLHPALVFTDHYIRRPEKTATGLPSSE